MTKSNWVSVEYLKGVVKIIYMLPLIFLPWGSEHCNTWHWMTCWLKQARATGAKQEATYLVQYQSACFLFIIRPQTWLKSKHPWINLLGSRLVHPMKQVGKLFLDSLLHNLYFSVCMCDISMAALQWYTTLLSLCQNKSNQLNKINKKNKNHHVTIQQRDV